MNDSMSMPMRDPKPDPMPMSDADMIVSMQMELSFKAHAMCILFSRWTIESTGKFIGAIFLMLLLSLLTVVLN